MANHLKLVREAEDVVRRNIAREPALYQDMTPEEFDDEVQDVLADWAAERAEYRMLYGEPEDTPCIQSADLFGTGEGRYHGIIG